MTAALTSMQTNNTAMESVKENLVKEDIYIENYDIYIKVVFLIFGCTSVVVSMFALVAMQRTKRVPYVAKYLSCGLLTFDMLFIVTSTARKFVLHPVINVNLTVFGNAWLQLAYSTVGIMALERMVVFNWPNYYLQMCTEKKLRTITGIIWCSVSFLFYFTRYAVCYLRTPSTNVFTQAGFCNSTVTIFYIMLVTVVQTTSFICYLKIYRIVQLKSGSGDRHRNLSFASVANMLKTYKSTSLVMLYLFVISSTSVAYAIILVTIRRLNMGITDLRLSLDTVSVINCILDPFLYAFWFRESRMQLLKCFMCLCPGLRSKTERMRHKIFGIMTKESMTSRSSDDVSTTVLAHSQSNGINFI